MRSTLAALVLTAGLVLSTTALAFGPGGPKGPPPPIGPLLDGLQQLDLDADQQAFLDDTLADIEATRPEPPARGERGERTRPSEEERAAHRAERKARAEQLEAVLGSAEPDATWLHAQLDDGPHRAAPEVAHEHLDQLLAVHATLSAEQRASLVQNLSDGRARHERRCDERSERGERGRRE